MKPLEGFVLPAHLPIDAKIASQGIAEGPQEAQVESLAQREANQRVEQNVILPGTQGEVRHAEIEPETHPPAVPQPEPQTGPAQLRRRARHRRASDFDPEVQPVELPIRRNPIGRTRFDSSLLAVSTAPGAVERPTPMARLVSSSPPMTPPKKPS